jgi:hypothetical protein
MRRFREAEAHNSRRPWMVAGLVALSSACASGADSGRPEPTASVDQRLFGAVTVDMTSTTGIISPVGLLVPGCSAVLVGPTAVVTAAHCVCDTSQPGPGRVMDPSELGFALPQAGGLFRNVARVEMHPTARAVCESIFASLVTFVSAVGEHDLAAIVLDTPVPQSIVQQPAELFIGAPEPLLDSGQLTFPSVQAGFGNTGPNDDDPGFGVRRFGGLNRLILSREPCGFGDLGECNDDWQWEVRGRDDSDHGPGDSGGALYLTLRGRPVLVGVISGHRGSNDTLDPTDNGAQVFAPTGDVGGESNAGFFAGAFGGDLDHDGAPDSVDNCPPLRCADPDDCANPDQIDDDHDSVGDACDNCPPSVCATLGARPNLDCVNPAQANDDGDAFGDRCDLCPRTPSGDRTNSFQPDDDGDGVGDQCDACDAPNAFPSCSVDGDCAALGRGTKCILDARTGDIAIGHCNGVGDSDDDGFPNECDTCAFANSSDRNSNAGAELRERELDAALKPLADDCDPVPIVRLDPQRAVNVAGSGALVPGDGRGPDDVVIIDGERWLGRETGSDPARTLSQAVSFRHCSCIDPSTGLKLEESDCVNKAPARCRWDQPLSRETLWRPITLQSNELQPVVLQTPSTRQTPAQSFIRGNFFRWSTVWRWRDDLVAGNVSGKGTCANSLSSCETHGAILTSVVKNATVVSVRDSTHALRDVFQMYDTPDVVFVPPNSGLPPQPCSDGPCSGWIDPVLHPDPPELGEFIRRFQSPVLIQAVSGVVQGAFPGGGMVDLTASMSPGVRRALETPGTLWLTPVESRSLLATFGVSGIQAAILPPDYVAGAEPELVFETPAGLFSSGDEGGEAETTDGVAPPATAASAFPPRSRSGIHGVFSVFDVAVYMVGGVADGVPTGAVWRFGLADRSWHMVAPNARVSPSSDVLGVAYDQPRRRLFVLDVDDEARLGHLGRGRLIAYDLGAGTSQLVETFLFTGTLELVRLAAMADGTVALVKGARNVFEVCRLELRDGRIKQKGKITGLGRVMDGPIMGQDELILPVVRHDRIEYVPLREEQFHGIGLCNVL